MSSYLNAPRLVRAVRRLALPGVMAALAMVLFGFAAPAHADNIVQIAAGLTNSKLYVTSLASSSMTTTDQAAVKTALNAASDTDLKAVVVANTASKQATLGMLVSVKNRVPGDTFVAITADGRLMSGISKKFSGTEMNQLIQQSAEGSDAKTRLIAFSKVAEAQAASQAKSGMVGTFVMLGVVILIVAGGAGLFMVARKKRLQREAVQMAELKGNVQEDVTRLGEEISALDLNVMDSALPEETRGDYTRALDSYDSAKKAVETARQPADMQQVTTALEDGRYYMIATRARLAGQPVPERRAPCFFNPQHGPSVTDVGWAPPGGVSRPVPACAADAARVLRGEDPHTRMMNVNGYQRPYWDAGPAYGPYAGGYYSGFGGTSMLSGILVGTAIGSMLGGGWGGGWGGGYGDGGGFGGGDSGGGFGGDSGDAGGGWDFGGGDFGGGGDWGGGGGGDF
jgi:hypothetical protein